LNLDQEVQVYDLEKRKGYRFRYQVCNQVGESGWSPESYLVPAVVPSAPPQPSYVSSSDSEIVLKFYRSQDDGGQPITDYQLWMDDGLLSNFQALASYDFATHGFEYTVSEVSMVAGLFYRFKISAINSLGYSESSDTLMVGLGPLPSQPMACYKAVDEILSSETSLYMQWDELISQTLVVNQYTLFMDDGYGVTYTA
jgi:hypothetical protein